MRTVRGACAGDSWRAAPGESKGRLGMFPVSSKPFAILSILEIFPCQRIPVEKPVV
ncbi:hypothetical protein BDI4_1050021 [Burkholderia diffusa]|nr:hypothetical protein BDI4_1050021 [Burkholderia diffusa]